MSRRFGEAEARTQMRTEDAMVRRDKIKRMKRQTIKIQKMKNKISSKQANKYLQRSRQKKGAYKDYKQQQAARPSGKSAPMQTLQMLYSST